MLFGQLQMVSDDGKKVRRKQPLSESDMEELQVGSIYLFYYYFIFLIKNKFDIFLFFIFKVF